MAKAAAIVLSSGGLHSLVTAGLASREYRVGMLHLQDGRVAGRMALAAFLKQVEHYKPLKHWTVEAGYLRQMALPPEAAGMAHSTGSDGQAGLIPLRELQMVMMAAGFAKQLHASTILWGVQHEQRAVDALAKNIEMVQLVNQLLELMTPDAPVQVKTPLMGLDDHQVVELGYQMGLPLGASWSCQMPAGSPAPPVPTAPNVGVEGPAPCMSCPACARRIRAFRAAQIADPLVTGGKK